MQLSRGLRRAAATGANLGLVFVVRVMLTEGVGVRAFQYVEVPINLLLQLPYPASFCIELFCTPSLIS